MNWRVILFSLIPLLIAGFMAYVRVSHNEQLLAPSQNVRSWQLEVHSNVLGKGKFAKIELELPIVTDRFEIISENFVSNGFAAAMINTENSRKTVWSGYIPENKQLDFFYRVQVQPRKERLAALPNPKISQLKLKESEEKEAKSVIRLVKSEGFKGREFIEELAKEVLKGKSEAAKNLRTGLKRGTEKAENLVKVFTLANFPARIVFGLELTQPDRGVRMFPWVEVFSEGSWHPIDLEKARMRISKSWFGWRRNANPLVSDKGLEKIETILSIAPLELGTLGRNEASKSGWLVSLHDFPVEAQALYRIIILLPLGALVVAFLRCVVGVKTFGTFMPVLIAFSFRETELLWGLALYLAVILFSLLSRYCFEHLQLLVVPRLTATLTLVVLVVLLFSGLMDFFNIRKGLSVALFPIVILTMMVERISVMLEELGLFPTMWQLLVTLFVATIVYSVVINPYVQYYMFTFPEMLLLILTLSILLGRFTGYRLTELYRFRSFLQN